jgi:hypothetical protein
MTMFAKRHYELLAKELQYSAAQALILDKHKEYVPGLRYFAEYLCVALKQDNPNFNEGRFLRACGLEE